MSLKDRASTPEAILTLDTELDRYIHRPPAKVLARLISRTPLTPNHITVLTLAPAAASSVLFSRGNAAASVASLLCFYLWAVLDHADGELARIKKMTSEFGRRLDDACDIIASNLMMIGLFIGLAVRSSSWPIYILAPIFAAALITEKVGGEVLLRAKRLARERALAKGLVEETFIRKQKFLDHLGGREPFYFVIFLTIGAESAGRIWPYVAMALLVGGCWAMALFSVAAAFRLRSQIR